MTSSAPSFPNPIPATFLRGGTSKGIFLTKASLPIDQGEWAPIFLGIMGSPDVSYGRQLNGMGGGVSSLSKICVISPPTPERQAQLGVQVEYTFVQVGIRDSSIDLSGNCGNLSCMVGAFAVAEGIVPKPTQADEGKETMTVRSFNTNTSKIIDTTFPISPLGNPLLTLPQISIAGVEGLGSQIVMEFVNPAGARTGALLPTRNPIDTIDVSFPIQNANADSSSTTTLEKEIPISLVDATNPTVFVSTSSLAPYLPLDDYFQNDPAATAIVNPVLEAIRQRGALLMGLDPQAQAQPKIALLSAPSTAKDDGVDIVVHALSMGSLHKTVPMTLGLCLGVAARTEGTLAWGIVRETAAGRDDGDKEKGFVRIRHSGGLVDVDAEFDQNALGGVKSAKVLRTGRFLMKGVVWW